MSDDLIERLHKWAGFGYGADASRAMMEAVARIAEFMAARIAYASEFEPNADGEPDVGSIHANIRAMKARLAALGSAQKENGELLTALAECRDAFPVPAAGGELEGHWLSAVANPDEVPAYVRACIESASKDAIRREAFEEAAQHITNGIEQVKQNGWTDCANERLRCAAAIRALSQKVGDQQ